MNAKITLSALALSLSAPGISQQSDKVSILSPVVVTGSGTAHIVDNSPVPVSVVTDEDLRNVGATNLQDALSQLTTSITTQTNGMGTFINFNGVSDNYIVILENGRRVSGDDRWNRISIDNVKRVEIFSGAASVLYGSDAIAGVINIITNESENTLNASSFTKILNNGRFNQDVNVDFRINKFSSSTSFNHRQANNWQVNHYQTFDEGDSTISKLTGRPMSVGFKSENISQKFKWTFNEKWEAYLRGDYYDYNTLRPKDATYFSQKVTKDAEGNKSYSYTSKKAYTYDLNHNSYVYGGGAAWKPSEKMHFNFDVNCDNFSSKYDYWQTEKEEARTETRKRTRFTNENINGLFELTKKNHLSVGIDLVQEHLESETDNISSKSTFTHNFFAHDEVNVRKWFDAVAGVRYTYNDNFGSNLTPNFSLFLHHKGLQFRASFASGYKTPTLSQLFATDQAKTASRYTINNTNLSPEKNNFWNINLGYGNKWMKANANAYINQVRDMINYRTLSNNEIENNDNLKSLYEEGWTTIRTRDNIDKAEIKGASIQLKFFLPLGFYINGSYTYTDSEAETKVFDNETQQYVVERNAVDKSVKNVGQLSVSWEKRWNKYGINVCLNGYAQDKRFSSTYGYAPGYGQWDLSTRHTIRCKQVVVEPGIGVENIFDKVDNSAWNSNFSTISPGRSFFVSLALKYKD